MITHRIPGAGLVDGRTVYLSAFRTIKRLKKRGQLLKLPSQEIMKDYCALIATGCSFIEYPASEEIVLCHPATSISGRAEIKEAVCVSID